jgi:outer membrane protein TolC
LTGRLKINALSQAIKTDPERVKLAESLLGAGVKSLVDVLIAQEDLLQTKKDFGDALKEFAMAHLKLRILTGSLADDQIAWVEKYSQTGRPH